jgi:hypothetical protein
MMKTPIIWTALGLLLLIPEVRLIKMLFLMVFSDFTMPSLTKVHHERLMMVMSRSPSIKQMPLFEMVMVTDTLLIIV